MQTIASPRFGARIEFYEQLDIDRAPVGELVGAASKEDAFIGLEGITAGARVATRSLAGGSSEVAVLHAADMDVPFARVARVEHYPVPLDAAGGVASWWEGSPRPAAIVVFHARAIDDVEWSMRLAQVLTSRRWHVDPALVKFAERRDR